MPYLPKIYAGNTKNASFDCRSIIRNGINNILPRKNVFKGQNVLIKPNFCGPGSVKHSYAMTNPELIIDLVEFTREQGANNITVADHAAGYVRDTSAFYDALGIMGLAKKYGFKFVNLRCHPFQELNDLKLSTVINDHSIIINTTLPKTHHQSTLSLCLKNLGMGLIDGRQEAHNKGDISDIIVRANIEIRKGRTVIDILDGRKGQDGNGPHFGNPIEPGFMLFGTDPVAVNATASRLMGFDPAGIKYIKLAEQSKLGIMDAEVIGDQVNPISIRPSPAWNMVPLNEELLVVFWLEKNMHHRVLYNLDKATQIYELALDMTKTYRGPFTEEQADNEFEDFLGPLMSPNVSVGWDKTTKSLKITFKP